MFDQIQTLLNNYDPTDKAILFTRFFLDLAHKQQESQLLKEACQVTKDLLILDEDLDGLGFETIINTWEEALNIRYGVDYTYSVNPSTQELELKLNGLK